MQKPIIKLDDEMKKAAINNIREYFISEREEDISDFSAEQLLDFIMNDIGLYIYNKGIQDAYAFMSEKVEDLIGLEKRFR